MGKIQNYSSHSYYSFPTKPFVNGAYPRANKSYQLYIVLWIFKFQLEKNEMFVNVANVFLMLLWQSLQRLVIGILSVSKFKLSVSKFKFICFRKKVEV